MSFVAFSKQYRRSNVADKEDSGFETIYVRNIDNTCQIQQW